MTKNLGLSPSKPVEEKREGSLPRLVFNGLFPIVAVGAAYLCGKYLFGF
jgi:hypothetical protein